MQHHSAMRAGHICCHRIYHRGGQKKWYPGQFFLCQWKFQEIFGTAGKFLQCSLLNPKKNLIIQMRFLYFGLKSGPQIP
jgi:hypothetical protein